MFFTLIFYVNSDVLLTVFRFRALMTTVLEASYRCQIWVISQMILSSIFVADNVVALPLLTGIKCEISLLVYFTLMWVMCWLKWKCLYCVNITLLCHNIWRIVHRVIKKSSIFKLWLNIIYPLSLHVVHKLNWMAIVHRLMLTFRPRLKPSLERSV